MNIELWEKVDAFVRGDDLDSAVQYLEERLARCESPRFKSLLRADFKNAGTEIAHNINEFVAFCQKRFDIKAVYLEMNGFTINPDRWFFDSFGYDKYVEDPDDLGWLSEPSSEDWPQVTLIGLEDVQKDYAWYSNESGYEDKSAETAEEYSALLVGCRFAQLIERAVKTKGIKTNTPILATAHDFEVIPRFFP